MHSCRVDLSITKARLESIKVALRGTLAFCPSANMLKVAKCMGFDKIIRECIFGLMTHGPDARRGTVIASITLVALKRIYRSSSLLQTRKVGR